MLKRRMLRSKKLRLSLIVAVVCLIFLIVAANAGPQKGDKPSDDWSRSLPLGQDVSGSIGLSVDEQRQRVHMIWRYDDEAGQRFRYVQLDQQGETIAGNDLDFPGHIRTPRLLPAGEETLHLVWASRLVGGANWELWHILLGPDGRPTGEPSKLSPDGSKVGRFVVSGDGSEGAVIAWDRASQGGLVMRRLDQAGKALSEAVVISPDGELPSLKVDLGGQAYLAWLQDQGFYYATLPVDNLGPIQGTVVVDFDDWSTLNSTGDTFQGPELGYAGGWIYIFSSVVSQSDTETGSGIAEYVAFPAESPSALMPQRLWALPAEKQPYEAFQSSLTLAELSRPLTIHEAADQYGRQVDYLSQMHGDWTELAGAASAYMLSPSAMIGDGQELAVAIAISQDHGLDSQLEIATLLFDEGRYLGYSIAGRTGSLSDDPVLVRGSNGDLHLAWREGAKGIGVSYATTAPAARSALDRLAISDFTHLVLQGGLDSLVSIMLLPVASWWIVPGLLLMALWVRFSRRETIADRMAWIPLVAAVVIYLALKLIFLPTMTSYVPFSAWLPVPSILNQPFRLGVPLIILLVALLAANKVRLRYSTSIVIFYVALVLTDTALTLAVYGVNWMGVF